MSTTETHGTQRVEFITSVQRRRRYSASEKMCIVNEIRKVGASVSSMARRHVLALSQLYQWRRAMQHGALAEVGSQEELVAKSELRRLQERTRRLQRLLGMKIEEVEVLKEAVRIGREKHSYRAQHRVADCETSRREH